MQQYHSSSLQQQHQQQAAAGSSRQQQATGRQQQAAAGSSRQQQAAAVVRFELEICGCVTKPCSLYLAGSLATKLKSQFSNKVSVTLGPVGPWSMVSEKKSTFWEFLCCIFWPEIRLCGTRTRTRTTTTRTRTRTTEQKQEQEGQEQEEQQLSLRQRFPIDVFYNLVL